MNAPARNLLAGQPFATVNGRRGTVGELLGAGGQGEVYQVDLGGLPFALKWYHDHYIDIDTGLRTRLTRAVRRGAPTSDFLWPLDLAEVPGQRSFGYIMPLREDSYVSIRDLIAPPPRRLELSLSRRANVCLQLANNFLELHANGFCYQDINFGNIFLQPDSGHILICDNDNVNTDGAEASIYGTRKFMAPEVVRRQQLPDSRTDLFSMAVLFFYVIFGWHPLDGARENAISLLNTDDELRLYGQEPVFLFDPADVSNGPVDGVHDWLVARWGSLTLPLRKLFIRSFGEGLHKPSARVLETEWRNALRRIIDATHSCADCGFEQAAETKAGKPVCHAECLCCGEKLESPLFLMIGKHLVSLCDGAEIAARLITGGMAGSDIAARVEEHPRKPGLFGLRNLTDDPWRAAMPDGSSYLVPAGQAVRIEDGMGIEFPKARGVMMAASVESAASGEMP